MNIGEELMKEHSLQQSKKIAAYAISSNKNFAALMKCFFDPEYRLSQRAAWAVCHAVQKHPQMIDPYLEAMVKQLQRKDLHNAILRNSVRILQDIEIPEKLHGEVLNACFDFIAEPTTPIAVKAFSLSILDKLGKKYPEILPELKLIIEDRWDTETPAFRSRGRKILKKMNS